MFTMERHWTPRFYSLFKCLQYHNNSCSATEAWVWVGKWPRLPSQQEEKGLDLRCPWPQSHFSWQPTGSTEQKSEPAPEERAAGSCGHRLNLTLCRNPKVDAGEGSSPPTRSAQMAKSRNQPARGRTWLLSPTASYKHFWEFLNIVYAKGYKDP